MIYDLSGRIRDAAYDIHGNRLEFVYDIHGNRIALGKDYSRYSISQISYLGTDGDWVQSIAYYGGVIFQTNGSGFQTISVETGQYIDSSVKPLPNAGHANSAQFSNEFYDPNDDFPLLYVSTCNETPNYVRVYRMTMNGGTLIRSFLMDTAVEGYILSSCVDNENKILYTLGLTSNNWSQQADGDTLILTKRDLNDLTDLGDGVYDARLIERLVLPYWQYAVQGLDFYDGYIWMSNGGGDTPNNIYVLNPENGEKVFTITIDNRIEQEGVAWVLDQPDSPWMLIGQQHRRYLKCTF